MKVYPRDACQSVSVNGWIELPEPIARSPNCATAAMPHSMRWIRTGGLMRLRPSSFGAARWVPGFPLRLYEAQPGHVVRDQPVARRALALEYRSEFVPTVDTAERRLNNRR